MNAGCIGFVNPKERVDYMDKLKAVKTAGSLEKR